MFLYVRINFLAVVDCGNWEVKFQGAVLHLEPMELGIICLFGSGTNQGQLIRIFLCYLH